VPVNEKAMCDDYALFRKFGRKLFLIYYSWVCGQIFERALNPHFFFDNTLKEVKLKCFKSFPTVGLFEMKEKLIDYFFATEDLLNC